VTLPVKAPIHVRLSSETPWRRSHRRLLT
jgi:hypothetical protein